MTAPEPQFDELYRELIVDHYRRPRNHGSLPAPTQQAEGVNPVCGDEVRLDVSIHDSVIDEIAFDGQGCAISQSSASMLTERVSGHSVDETQDVIGKFRAMMVDGAAPDSALGDLVALEGVAQLPVRVKCALLAWNVLQEALQQAAPAAGKGPA
jgi:nitrogen fixation NifU-like protein